MGAAIVAFFTALPALIGLLRDLIGFIQNQTKEDPVTIIRDAHAVFSQAKAAKTPEEKADAAKKIQDLLHRL